VIDALDLLGTLVFAVSGAFRAVKYELDILGVLVLSVATGVGGGIIRDVVLGATPPAAFRDETYLLLCILGGLVVFVAAPTIAPRWDWVMGADAIGLGVFAAIGGAKAADNEMGFVGIARMAALTATGGGVVRDVMVREIPAVIRADFYATAALLGGVALLIARSAGLPQTPQLVLAIVVTSGLRLVGMRYRLSLPKVRSLPASPSAIARARRIRKLRMRSKRNAKRN